MNSATSAQSRILVTGNCDFAKELSFVLRASHVTLPVQRRLSCAAPRAVLVIAASDDDAITVVRLHRSLWQKLAIKQTRWIIVAENERHANSIRRQDVYGRIRGGETFHKWSDRYAILTRKNGLTAILDSIDRLKPMWRRTWETHDCGIQAIQSLKRGLEIAVQTNDYTGQRDLLRNLPALTWECFCDHDHANRIRGWLARDEICPAWFGEGIEVLSQLTNGS